MAIGLAYVTTMTIELGEQLIIGETPLGIRRVSPILSGSVEGPRLNGTIVPGGADWNLALGDGSIEFYARYTIQTDDGALISVLNEGLERHVMAKLFAGEPVDPAGPMYGRTAPRFEVGDSPHGWLRRSLFAAELILGRPGQAILHVHEIT